MLGRSFVRWTKVSIAEHFSSPCSILILCFLMQLINPIFSYSLSKLLPPSIKSSLTRRDQKIFAANRRSAQSSRESHLFRDASLSYKDSEIFSELSFSSFPSLSNEARNRGLSSLWAFHYDLCNRNTIERCYLEFRLGEG